MEWYARKGEEVLLRIPYGEDILSLPVRLAAEPHVLLPREAPAGITQDLLSEGLERPLDTPPLSQIIAGRREAAVVVDDDTRPRYAAAILPSLLRFLKANGVRKAKIIIALGLHRPLEETRKRAILGQLPPWVEVQNHDPHHDLCALGKVGGRQVLLNRHFMSAPLKVVIGDVELHQIFGYGGGAKSLVPGLSDPGTIRWLHSLLTHPQAQPGVLDGNPVQEFLKQIYAKAEVDFSIQVVLSTNGGTQALYTGSLSETFRRGIAAVDALYKVKVKDPFDVLIASVGGYPRDADLYQTQKVINMVRAGIKKGGTLILFSRCDDGIGPEEFSRWLGQGLGKGDVERMMEERFEMGLHKLYLFAKGTQDTEVYLYSSVPPDLVRRSFLTPLETLEEAAELVRGQRIGFVPFGTVTLLERAWSRRGQP